MSGVNLQDTFLEQAKNNNYVVMVHLVGKVKLVGTVKDFDKYSVTINSYGQDQLIYKQAIATIVLPRGRSTRLMITRPAGEGQPEGQEREHSDRPPRRPFRPQGGPRGPRPGGPRPGGPPRSFDRGDRPSFDRGDRPSFDRGDRPSFDRGDRGSFDRGPRPSRPPFNRDDRGGGGDNRE